MDEAFQRKYTRVREILPDVAECAQSKLILVGGTALALFYLNHRVSIDLDFVPVSGDDITLKEELKGCLSKRGYRTIRGALRNQFVVQFKDTSIKVEVFMPEKKVLHVEERVFGAVSIRVASLEDILRMKISAYEDRKEARDLFDIFCILKKRGDSLAILKELVSKNGVPDSTSDLDSMAMDPQDAVAVREAISDVA